MRDRKPLTRYLAPKYWPVWLGMGLLRVVVALPHGAGLAIGRALGRMVHRCSATRRAVVRRNLELCFPELDRDGRNALAKRHFEALGMSLVEMGLGRWASDAKIRRLMRLEGIEHLDRAVAEGRGVILLSAHFTTLEATGRMLAYESPPFDAVYRKNRSDFVTELQRTGREVSADATIEKRDIKKVVRSLRAGRPVWYAADQSFDRKGAVVVEFFGVPCMHTTATSALARLGDAVVLPYFPRRLDDNSYVMTIGARFENFPGRRPDRGHRTLRACAGGTHSALPGAVLLDTPEVQEPAARLPGLLRGPGRLEVAGEQRGPLGTAEIEIRMHGTQLAQATVQAHEGLLLPGTRLPQAPPVEIQHPEAVLYVDLQIVGIHVGMIDARRMKLLDVGTDRAPVRRLARSVRNDLRKGTDVGNTQRDDVRGVEKPAPDVAGSRRPGHAQPIVCHLREHAPFAKGPRIVLARPDVMVTNELAGQAAATIVAQHELPRPVADEERRAATA